MHRALAVLPGCVVALALLATTALSQPEACPLIDTLGSMLFQGLRADGHLGNPARAVGDLNGDGIEDFAIAEHENGSTRRGSVYVYFGGPGLDNLPDLTLTGQGASDRFGSGVADAGDVNNDGYGDLIVGAFQPGFAGNGRAYIYLGGSSMDTIPDLALTGQGFDDFFGYDVSSAGDVNGDLFDDFMVAAPLNDGGGGNAGRVYLYHGGPVLDGTADLVFTGGPGHALGVSLGNAGDVNGDGFDDVLMSSTSAGSGEGYVYLHFGGSGMDNIADVVFVGQYPGDRLGYFRGISSKPGDINGDGYCDVVAPAPWSGPEDMCRVFVYHGGPGLDNTADVIIPIEPIVPWQGMVPVSIGGDINNDGFDDIVVGISASSEGGYWAGMAYVFLGGAVMDTVPDARFPGREVGDWFGTSVAIVGDQNDDGYDDILVSAYEAGQYQPAPGYAKLYFMHANIFPLSVDIHPGSCPNPLNTRGRGVMPVAILGTPEFDVHSLDPTGITLNGVPPLLWVYEDVGSPGVLQPVECTDCNRLPPDGYIDLSLKFDAREIVAGLGPVSPGDCRALTLEGTLGCGQPAAGQDVVRIVGGGAVSLEKPSADGREALPGAFTLGANHPNPFNPVTTIRYELPVPGHVVLKVYDLLGREVVTLVNEEESAGYKAVQWDARGVASGVYLYRLEAGTFTSMKKMVVIR